MTGRLSVGPTGNRPGGAHGQHGKGNVAVFNAFEGAPRICAVRAQLFKYVLKDYPNVKVIPRSAP
jgi:hypothetical protein